MSLPSSCTRIFNTYLEPYYNLYLLQKNKNNRIYSRDLMLFLFIFSFYTTYLLQVRNRNNRGSSSALHTLLRLKALENFLLKYVYYLPKFKLPLNTLFHCKKWLSFSPNLICTSRVCTSVISVFPDRQQLLHHEGKRLPATPPHHRLRWLFWPRISKPNISVIVSPWTIW